MTESYKPVKVSMDFTARSKILQNCKNYLCDWGEIKVPKNKEGKPIGSTAPLWLNEDTFFFKCFSVLFLIVGILFIAVYVFLRFYNRNNVNSGLLVRNYTMLSPNATYEEFIANTTTTNSTAVQPSDVYCMYISYNKINSIFVIIGGIILFLNFIHLMYIGCFEYASDREWSRNLAISSIIWVIMIGFIVGDFIYTVSLIVYYNDNKIGDTALFNSNTPKCNNLFQVNMYGYLITAIIASILAVFQIIKIFQLVKQFFWTYYVPHTARCEDENIVVIT